MQELLVCIVDDDEAVRISIRMLIETLGVPARAYAGAQAFLDDREVHTLCGCLVLDVRMPGMSGLQLQEHLDGPLENLPVIFLSGHGDVPMVVRAMRAGAIDFLQTGMDQGEIRKQDPALLLFTLYTAVVGSLTEASVLNAVRKAPLVSSRAMGRFSLRDLKIASGELSATDDETPPEQAGIDAAFMDAPAEDVQGTLQFIQESIEAVTGIEATLTDKVGAANATDLSPLVSLLRECAHAVNEQLARRGLGSADVAPVGGDEVAASGGAAAPVARAGEIGSREDVIRVLDKMCDWYSRAEPSSPVPILLRRAKKLVHMDFMDIVRDLAPDGLSQVERFRGEEPGEGD